MPPSIGLACCHMVLLVSFLAFLPLFIAAECSVSEVEEEDIAVDDTTTTTTTITVSIRTNKEDVGEDFRTGDELRLWCIVEGNRRQTPSIRWVFNNATALVDGADGISIAHRDPFNGGYGSTVTIQSASEQHGGIYTCTVGFGGQEQVDSRAVHLRHQDTLFMLGEPRSHYVGVYGEPFDFTCSSHTKRHSVMCQATKVVPQNVQPWAWSCLNRKKIYNIKREFRIATLNEKYAGQYHCTLSRYSFYTPPPENRSDIFFSIAIKESAPQTASLNIEVIDEETIPGQLSPHQVITVVGPYPNTSTIFVKNWSPAKKLTFNISCVTEKTVYPAPQMSLESLRVDLTSLGVSLHRRRTVNHAELVSGVHIVPGDQLRCSAFNKMGGVASTVLVKSGAELEVFPYNRTVATHNGKRNESYIFHVYGAPLTWLNACLKSEGWRRWCSGRKQAMQNFTTSVLKNGSIEVMLSWTHGHVERGNVFGKVIWSISLDESQDLLESLPNVSCQIKIYDSFTRDRKDFMMRLHDALSANKEDYHLPIEDIAIDGTATTTTTTATTAVSTAVSIQTNKEHVGEDFRTGDELRLECIVEGRRRRTPNIRWVFNNATALVDGTFGVSIARITTDKGGYRSTVTIQSASEQHGGIYTCTVGFGGQEQVDSRAVHLRHQDTLFVLGEPRSHYVGVYGEPFDFTCSSHTKRHSVMCQATKVVPQNVQPWAWSCLDRKKIYNIKREFRIATLNEKYAGQYHCTLSRYSFYTPPPENRSDIFFSIAIKESAPQTASLNIEVIDEEAIPGQLSPHQVITVVGPYPNTSTIFVKNWSPAKKLTFNISCVTEKTVYPAPQMSLESLRVDLTSLGVSLHRRRTVNHAELVSGVHIVPGDQLRCSASNKMGGFASTVLVKSGVEPLVIPIVEEADENETQTSTSFTSHVYGMPLEEMNACIEVDGFCEGRFCTGEFLPADHVTVTIGVFDNSTAYFTWSYVHTDRGNLFGKATWTLSGDSSEEHFQLAYFTLHIRNPYTGRRMKKFVFNSESVQLSSAAATNDLVADQRGWPELSSLVTAKPHV